MAEVSNRHPLDWSFAVPEIFNFTVLDGDSFDIQCNKDNEEVILTLAASFGTPDITGGQALDYMKNR